MNPFDLPSAPATSQARTTPTIWLVLLPSTHILDLAGPLQVFASCGEMGWAPLDVRCVSIDQQVYAYQGIALSGLEPLPTYLRDDDVILVIGSKRNTSPAYLSAERRTAAWLREVADAHPDMALGSICTGAFVLGEAGLLDGRKCTTHYRYTDDLQRLFPKASVVENRVFVEDERLATSAGVATGTDLALHLVGKLVDPKISNAVAQELVVFRRRAGSDPQLSIWTSARNHLNTRIHRIQDQLQQDFCTSIDLQDLANQAHVSYLHLARMFRAETGMTLSKYLTSLRIEHARSLLRDTPIGIDQIAVMSGFQTTHAFRAAWRKEERISPTDFRKMPRSRLPDAIAHEEDDVDDELQAVDAEL